MPQAYAPIEALRRALGNDVLKFTGSPSRKAPMQDIFVLPLKIPKWSIWSGAEHVEFLNEKKEREQQNESCGAFKVYFTVI